MEGIERWNISASVAVILIVLARPMNVQSVAVVMIAASARSQCSHAQSRRLPGAGTG